MPFASSHFHTINPVQPVKSQVSRKRPSPFIVSCTIFLNLFFLSNFGRLWTPSLKNNLRYRRKPSFFVKIWLRTTWDGTINYSLSIRNCVLSLWILSWTPDSSSFWVAGVFGRNYLNFPGGNARIFLYFPPHVLWGMEEKEGMGWGNKSQVLSPFREKTGV